MSRITGALLGLITVTMVAAGLAACVPSQPPVPQPGAPIRAAFYYGWYPGAWQQQGLNPFTHYHPSAGLYSSQDVATVRHQVAAMQYGGLQAGIASWWGQGSSTDVALAVQLQAAAGTSFRWSVYYEPEGQTNQSLAHIEADLRYLKAHDTTNPNYLTLNGRPVIFVYNTADATCAATTKWHQAAVDTGFYVDLKVFAGYQTCPTQPDNWHQYAPSSAVDTQGNHAIAISPGFWKANEPTPRLARDLSRWRANVAQLAASSAQFQLVSTFNEWGEGTAVESATEWQSPSGYGAYLDALHVALGGATTPTLAATLAPAKHRTTHHHDDDDVGHHHATHHHHVTRHHHPPTTRPPTPATTMPPVHTPPTTRPPVVTPPSTKPPVVTPPTTKPPVLPPPTTTPPPAGGPCRSAPRVAIHHVVEVYMENHSYNQVIGTAGAPYETSLANQCVSFTHFATVGSPSYPNYLGATSGSTQGKSDDSTTTFTVDNIFRQVRHAGLTAREYHDGASACAQVGAGNAAKHEPRLSYVGADDQATRCTETPPLSQLDPNNLPNYAFITPTLCNDDHDCSVATGDGWLRTHLGAILAGANYRSGDTLVELIFDEPTPLANVFLNPAFGHVVSPLAINHYAELRYNEERFGLPLLANAAGAPDLASVLG